MLEARHELFMRRITLLCEREQQQNGGSINHYATGDTLLCDGIVEH